MPHTIHRYQNNDPAAPGLLYRPCRNYMRRSVFIFAGCVVGFSVGSVIVVDYLSGWPQTCGGNPIPAWPMVFGWLMVAVFGFFGFRRGIAMARILDPFASDGYAIDARDAPAKSARKQKAGVEAASEEFDKRTASKSEAAKDDTVIEGEFSLDGMPA